MQGVTTVKLLDSRVSPEGDKKSSGPRRRTVGRDRSGRALCLLSLLLAFVGAGSALFFGGGTQEEQPTVETVVSQTAEDTPATEARPGFDTEALGDRLEEIAEEHSGIYGVAVLEPASGTRVSLRGDEEFMAASIGKLPVLAALYKAAARGELDLEEEISILPEDYQEGAGGLQAFPEGYSLSLRECAYRLVNHSDNTAWAMLDRYLGEDRIRAGLEEMAIKDSRYSDDLSGYFTTPNDVLLLLERISDPDFTSEKLASEMLDGMTQTAFEDRIPERLPPEVRIAHKTGSYEDNFGDAAVVFFRDEQGFERHYYLTVLAGETGEYEARDAIQSISLAVYEALAGVKVDSGWSRGGADSLESNAEDLVEPQADRVEYNDAVLDLPFEFPAPPGQDSWGTAGREEPWETANWETPAPAFRKEAYDQEGAPVPYSSLQYR